MATHSNILAWIRAGGAGPEPSPGPGEGSPRFPSRWPRCPPPGASRRLRGEEIPAAGAGLERAGDWLGTAGRLLSGAISTCQPLDKLL